MKTISYLLVGLALLGAAACSNSQFKRTKSGLQYKIFSAGTGATAKKGEILKMQLVQKVRDSVLYSTYGGFPFYIPVDSPRPIYSPTEIFMMLRKGDSAVAILSADSISRKSGGLPPFMKKKDKIVISLKVLNIFTSQEEMMADRKEEADKEKGREVSAIEKYLADSNVHATKTALGTYIVVKDPGNGPAVDSGKQVAIHYAAKFFPSGKVFESNMNGPGNEPFKFVVGRQPPGAIAGMEDGVRQLHQGGKATLYVPAFLAYDARPAGPGHKPYEDLIFDIVVDSVTAAPPAPAMRPGMPYPQGMRPGAYPVRPGAPQPQAVRPTKPAH